MKCIKGEELESVWPFSFQRWAKRPNRVLSFHVPSAQPKSSWEKIASKNPKCDILKKLLAHKTSIYIRCNSCSRSLPLSLSYLAPTYSYSRYTRILLVHCILHDARFVLFSSHSVHFLFSQVQILMIVYSMALFVSFFFLMVHIFFISFAAIQIPAYIVRCKIAWNLWLFISLL